MNEIGGYIELDTYSRPMLHEDAYALNCGRNALAYLIEARHITKIRIPYFMCDTGKDICEKYHVSYKFYHIDFHFQPEPLKLEEDEWLYLVNFYGQLSRNELEQLVQQYERVIIDNAHAYFDLPLDGVDTLYTCRKFFGVSDGAFLYSNIKLDRALPQDESFNRIRYILGRFERTAGEFFQESVENNKHFADEPIKEMSKLTRNLLHAVDYEEVKRKRNSNYLYLNDRLKGINKLEVKMIEGAYMYPLMVDHAPMIRKKLIEKKIFIPVLWPNVLSDCSEIWTEWKLANNILPLPVDQRYSEEDMQYLLDCLFEYL